MLGGTRVNSDTSGHLSGVALSSRGDADFSFNDL